MGRDFSVGRLRHMGVQLHRQARRGMPETLLDHSGMLAGLDHEAGRHVA
jgi:hypothetical protein